MAVLGNSKWFCAWNVCGMWVARGCTLAVFQIASGGVVDDCEWFGDAKHQNTTPQDYMVSVCSGNILNVC